MRERGVIVWFRQDLRLADNPALEAAAAGGRPVIPVYIWAPDEEGGWPPGAASRLWLHRSLEKLAAALAGRGSPLILRRGPSLTALCDLAAETGAGAVFWNRRCEPAAIGRDAAVRIALQARGLTAATFNAALLFEPEAIATGEGKPYQVFTPFWNACLAAGDPPAPRPAPRRLAPPEIAPPTLALARLDIERRAGWGDGVLSGWRPGEQGARQVLQRFLRDALEDYPAGRDRPGSAGSSRLSPHLHFGEIGPRQVYEAVHRRLGAGGASGSRRGDRSPAPRSDDAAAARSFLRELGWREFALHLLVHWPGTQDAPLRDAFARFPWRDDRKSLDAWRSGRTGFPIVDAAMRELRTTGFMHNRARMVAASFLVKDLGIDWREGARWFWDALLDADLASNTLGWQWAAGCGADAAPFVRIFNPVLQAERFDPEGVYVRRFVPELARLPAPHIHRPWDAPSDRLAEAGVTLGSSYPRPIVDHAFARRRALAAFATLRSRPRALQSPARALRSPARAPRERR